MSLTNPYAPIPGGLAGLPGANGGILARGLTPPGPLFGPPIPMGPLGSLSSQLPSASSSLTGNPLTASRSLASQAAPVAGRAATRASLPGIFGNVGKAGSLARGLAPVVGQFGAEAIFGSGDENKLTEAARGFTRGAAWAPAVAPFVAGLGPLAPAGGALLAGTAAITGSLGALADVLDLGGFLGFGGGEDEAPDPIEILGTGIEAAGLSPDQTEEILETYEVMTALAEMQPEGEARDAAMQQAFDAASAMILQAMQQEEQMAASSGNQLALQAQAADIFEPLARDIEMSSAAYGSAMQGINKYLPEQFRAINDATVARELSSADRLANAYRAQAQVIPAVSQLTQYQRDYNALAAQMFQQAQAQSLQGAGGGQTADVAALLTAGV